MTASSPALGPQGIDDAAIQRRCSVSDRALKKFQLIEALRTGNHVQLDQAVADWVKDHQSQAQGHTYADTEASTGQSPYTPLHLAIQFATKATVEYILTILPVELLNSQDAHGWTALHHAAKAGRADVVRLLLTQPSIDDLVADHQGRDPSRVAKTPELAEQIRTNRQEFIHRSVAAMHEHTCHGDVASLDKLCEATRFQKLVDINAPNPENSGNTVLHEAVEAGNFELVKWWCSRGADVFIRNDKGHIPADLTQDTRISNVLDHAPMAALRPTSPGKAPRLQGYMLKWTNYATGYRRRYFVLENGVLSYYKDKANAESACRGAINLKIATMKFEARDQTAFEVQGKGSVRYRLKTEYSVEAKRWMLALTQSKQWALDNAESRPAADAQSVTTRPTIDTQHVTGPGSATSASPGPDRLLDTKSLASEGAGDTLGTSQSDVSHATGGLKPGRPLSRSPSFISDDDDAEAPHEESYDLTVNALEAQLSAHNQLLEALATAVPTSASSPTTESSDRLPKLVHAYTRASKEIASLVRDALSQSQDRVLYWQNRYQREVDRQNVLAESFRALLIEQDKLEHIARSQRERHKKMSASRPPTQHVSPAASQPPETATVADALLADSGTAEQVSVSNSAPTPDVAAAVDAIESDWSEPSDDEDQFFDAEDLEELVPDEPETLPSASDDQKQVYIAPSYVGYPVDGQLRQQLHPNASQRPSISLWSILKSSVGKDLSRISMPVFLNEPTSMLQRMAEDMEYSDLLDMASRHRHSSERILFIAAWAMGNYSSTMGRVAKPFNPLLGETFEYVRPDKQYRYVSEQVSHHPPISACYCDGPNYNFFAEVNMKSKFWGKSFEICPLGVSHVELKVPMQFLAPDDPNQPKVIDRKAGRFIEHYSWKKVTTSVQGLITGSPWMEHYGDMDIVNHRTGETCRLTFKQSNWRGNNLYVIQGASKDPQGNEVWEIAGRWDQRLIARPAHQGHSSKPLSANDLDAESHGDVKSIGDDTKSKPVLLWRRETLPDPPLPYNLTRFAGTLNDLPDSLKPYLCPTDSRLRPDQRALEDGQFDLASDEKNRVEESQRARRREREADPNAGSWEPRWFSRAIEPDTNEPFWQFNFEYWKEREKATQAVQHGEAPEWKNVPRIFE
ncbi:hypothetical protein H4R35_001651 [Dimargaris xerosporica]|nr:hypothetical protein H4R35_001651 [Dimargaris xerosporica]